MGNVTVHMSIVSVLKDFSVSVSATDGLRFSSLASPRERGGSGLGLYPEIQ